MSTLHTLVGYWNALPPDLQLTIRSIVFIIILIVCLVLAVAYMTYAERRVIGFMQVRMGPNRVGWWGLLQPFADVLKLVFKEVVLPTNADRFLFIVAPIISITTALAAWAVIPFSNGVMLSNANAGLLYLLAVSSFGVYGIILSGWPRTRAMLFSAPCARRRRWWPTRSPWASPWSAYCSPAAV